MKRFVEGTDRGHEVTNVGSDRAQLAHMATETKATLEVANLDVIADRGYFSSEEILECDKASITVTLPKPMTSNAKAEGRFGKQDFRYVATEDVYVCPARLPLHNRRKRISPAPPRRDGSRDGSMSMFSRRCSAGSTSIRRRCASDVRRSSIPSERSRPGWELPTS